jgi:hypothetical protein
VGCCEESGDKSETSRMTPADKLHRCIERSPDSGYDADASDVPEFLSRRRTSSAKLLGRVTP